jgi:hypothetical protein
MPDRVSHLCHTDLRKVARPAGLAHFHVGRIGSVSSSLNLDSDGLVLRPPRPAALYLRLDAGSRLHRTRLFGPVLRNGHGKMFGRSQRELEPSSASWSDERSRLFPARYRQARFGANVYHEDLYRRRGRPTGITASCPE